MARCGYCKTRLKSVANHFNQYGCEKDKEQWAKVIELRRTGQESRADRLARRLLGVWEPMDEQTKEKLRLYNEEHADEIKERRALKKMQERILRQRLG